MAVRPMEGDIPLLCGYRVLTPRCRPEEFQEMEEWCRANVRRGTWSTRLEGYQPTTGLYTGWMWSFHSEDDAVLFRLRYT